MQKLHGTLQDSSFAEALACTSFGTQGAMRKQDLHRRVQELTETTDVGPKPWRISGQSGRLWIRCLTNLAIGRRSRWMDRLGRTWAEAVLGPGPARTIVGPGQTKFQTSRTPKT